MDIWKMERHSAKKLILKLHQVVFIQNEWVSKGNDIVIVKCIE